LQAQNQQLNQVNQQQAQQLRQVPTLKELAASNLVFTMKQPAAPTHIQTTLFASTTTKHAPAIVLAKEFWQSRNSYRPPTSIDSEADVNVPIFSLLTIVINSLGCRTLLSL
jgi:hypothetical protein